MADGIMAIWMDCDAEHLADFDAWYDRQHLYERTSTPGFVTGTRYRAIRGRPAFGAVYETESPAVMRSEAYLARLEKPTAWTSRVMPHFRNTIRTVFSRTLDFGAGRGAFAATIGFRPRPSRADDLVGWLGADGLQRVQEYPGVVRAALWQADDEATGSPAAEQGLRGATDGRDAWVLFVEGTDAGLLSAACREVLPARTLVEEGAAPGRRSGLYRMLVTLRHEEA